MSQFFDSVGLAFFWAAGEPASDVVRRLALLKTLNASEWHGQPAGSVMLYQMDWNRRGACYRFLRMPKHLGCGILSVDAYAMQDFNLYVFGEHIPPG